MKPAASQYSENNHNGSKPNSPTNRIGLSKMVSLNIGTDDPAYHWKKYIPVKLTIHPETFVVTRQDHHEPNQPSVYREVGTVECSFGKNRKQIVNAVRYQRGDIWLMGFVGCYETSSRLWRVSVGWNPVSKSEIELWDGDDYRPNGTKVPLIYNPILWSSLTKSDGRSKDEVKNQ